MINEIGVLRILSDGNVHSGVEIGNALGVSRTSVWKMVSQLESYGIDVTTVKGKGYKLSGSLELLDLYKINQRIGGSQAFISEMEIFHKIDSTNKYLLAKGMLDADKYQLCLAEMQTAGRGRRGKEWLSPFGQNIYLSLMFNVDGGVKSISGLSLAVGVSISNTLNKLGVISSLKWPNDVFVGGKKIAGILVELEGVSEDSWKVVVGVGVNVSMTDLPKDCSIDQAWTSLMQEVKADSLGRNEIVSMMIDELVSDINMFKLKGFKPYKDIWESKDVFREKEIQSLGGRFQGVGAGVDDLGALKIRTSSGIKLITAGEVVSV